MSAFRLVKTRIQAGVYEGKLTASNSDGSMPKLEILHLNKPVGKIQLLADKKISGGWSLTAGIPAELLSDGVQIFSIRDTDSGSTLDSFAIITGEPVEDDIRAEVALLRAELDMLKKVFRRHCVETSA